MQKLYYTTQTQAKCAVYCWQLCRQLLVGAGLLLVVSTARAQTWQTATALSKSTGGPNSASVSATATDASGNIYLAGTFQGTVSFGSISLVSAGTQDVFITKRSPTGSFLWAQRAGGYGYDQTTSLVVNENGIYIAGVFTSESAAFGTTTLLNPCASSAFVAKLTDAGNSASFTWAQRAGGSSKDVVSIAGAQSLAVSGTSVYLGGYFSNPKASFGTIELTNSGGSYNPSDAFVAKLTDAGSSASFTWARQIGGTGVDGVSAIAVNGNNVYVAGDSSSPTINFGSTAVANAGALGSYDLFIAKLTDGGATGNFTWALAAGGNGNEYMNALAFSEGNLYVTGSFRSATLTLGAAVLANATTGTADLFVAKLTDSGTSPSFAWAQRAGGTSDDNPASIAVKGAGVYLAGSFSSSSVSFGPSTLVKPKGSIFVTKLIEAGATANFMWGQQAGGAETDRAVSIFLRDNSICVAGIVSPPSSFGNLAITASDDRYVSFLASLNDNGVLATNSPTSPVGSIALLPNPARNKTLVQLPPLPAGAPYTLTLFDLLGRVVLAPISTVGAEATLNLTGLASGVYVLRVQAGATLTTRRLVVE